MIDKIFITHRMRMLNSFFEVILLEKIIVFRVRIIIYVEHSEVKIQACYFLKFYSIFRFFSPFSVRWPFFGPIALFRSNSPVSVNYMIAHPSFYSLELTRNRLKSFEIRTSDT